MVGREGVGCQGHVDTCGYLWHQAVPIVVHDSDVPLRGTGLPENHTKGDGEGGKRPFPMHPWLPRGALGSANFPRAARAPRTAAKCTENGTPQPGLQHGPQTGHTALGLFWPHCSTKRPERSLPFPVRLQPDRYLPPCPLPKAKLPKQKRKNVIAINGTVRGAPVAQSMPQHMMCH